MRSLARFKGEAESPIILLRFDIDYSPQMALEIAKINASLNISGTFFILMDSLLYNLFHKNTQELLKNLHLLKQEIGWHVSFIKGKTTKNSLIDGWEIFKKAVPHAVPLIAWHNPVKGLLEEANSMVESTGLLKSVNAPPYISRNIKYLSDSNHRNGFKDLMKILHVNKNPQVQLLLHPFNWVIGGDDMSTVLTATWKVLLRTLNKEFSINPNWQCPIYED